MLESDGSNPAELSKYESYRWFVECDGVRLHYIDRGETDAPCVVLFHGNGTMLQDLQISGLVDLLARGHRVLCFDRPGFGHSQRPRSRIWTATAQAALFANALQQLGVRNPAVLGHSWGTLVAIALALRSDYPIRGIVLASGYYFPNMRLDFWLMSGPAIPLFGDLIRYTVAPIISYLILPSLLRKLFSPRPVPAEYQQVSRLPHTATETAEGGCGGECLPCSRRGTIRGAISQHRVPGPALPRRTGPSDRARAVATSPGGARPLSTPARRERRAHGYLCRC